MKNRGLLLDRDGVINIDHGYVGKREQFEFITGIFDFLRWAQNAGFRLALITNQSGVARGYYTAQDFYDTTEGMKQDLAREGIAFDLILACFEHEKGAVPEWSRASMWRKPNPGMVLEAIQRLNLDPQRSAFLGDKPTDMEAAARGEISTRLLLGDESAPDCTRVHNFTEAQEKLSALLS